MRTLPLTILLLAGALTNAAAAYAQAGACPSRLAVSHGDTLSSIARACGVNVQALLGVNPGLTPRTLQAGSYITVPQAPFTAPRFGIGRPSIQPMPQMVPPATGGPSIGGPASTVILPPTQPPVPPQHILRGFGDLPGQLPLPPGHIGTMPENLFPHQRN